MGTTADPPALLAGRIIVPGTDRQLGRHGLFPPSPAQQRTLRPGFHDFAAKAAVPELLWISFQALCAPGATGEDFSHLAEQCGQWVIDEVPDPHAWEAGPGADAWERFAAALDVLARRRIPLFLVGNHTMDWAAAAAACKELRGRAVLNAIELLLRGLVRVESDETLAIEGISGS